MSGRSPHLVRCDAGVLTRTVRSLHHPNYRRFISGHAVSVIGTWMQRVAQDWLVLELTGSPIAIGVATALQFLPMLLLGMWGGVLVDRFDRWKLIMGTQAASAVLATILAVATLVDATTLALVYVMAGLLGLVTVVDKPGRNAFITDLVPPTDYVNAQALNSTIHNAGRLVGPAAAGLLIATFGAGPAFAVNALSFLAVLAGLARVDRAALRGTTRLERGKGQAVAGLRYAWRHRELRACLFLVAVAGVFSQHFRVILPVTATEVLGGDAATYGFLTAALGLGAVLGAVAAASTEAVTGPRLVAAAVGLGGMNLLMSIAANLWFALAGLVALGAAHIVFTTLSVSVVQLRCAPEMVGRVMALHGLLNLGTNPIGAPLLGWVCAAAGSAWGFIVAGATVLLAAGAARALWGQRSCPEPAEDAVGGARQASPRRRPEAHERRQGGPPLARGAAVLRPEGDPLDPWPALADVAAFAGAFAADYLSWDEDNPQHRAAALHPYLQQHCIATPQPGWNGHGRRTADLSLPGTVDTHHHPLLVVDVRVRYTPCERANDRDASCGGAPSPAAGRRPPAVRWRPLPQRWTRLTVPVWHTQGRLQIDIDRVRNELEPPTWPIHTCRNPTPPLPEAGAGAAVPRWPRQVHPAPPASTAGRAPD